MAENETPSESTENNAIPPVDNTPKAGDVPSGALGGAVEENNTLESTVDGDTGAENDFDSDKPSLVGQSDGTYALYKRGTASRCPVIQPSRYASTDGKSRFIEFQACCSICALARITPNPEKEGDMIYTTCGHDSEYNKYYISKGNITPYVKPEGEPEKKEGIIRSIK